MLHGILLVSGLGKVHLHEDFGLHGIEALPQNFISIESLIEHFIVGTGSSNEELIVVI